MADAGLALEVDQQFRFQAKGVLSRLAMVKEEVEDSVSFLPIFQMVRAKVIDQAYNRQSPAVDVEALLKLNGRNNSELNYEVFRPSIAKRCTPHTFEARTRLKIGRTILNLKELRKAYGSSQLQELEEQLHNYLQSGGNPFVLRQKLVVLSRSSNFSTYLQLKQEFLEEWTQSQASFQGKFDPAPLADAALSDTMKALFQQKPIIHQKSQVLRFTDYQFFRQFNASTHNAIESNHLDFWKTEENRNHFVQMIQTIRNKYPVEAPFNIFRFENSFTYLLCGFSDDSTAEAILHDQTTAPVHAKILMRQSNKAYRELHSHDMGNRTLYFNCLKEAMLPFVEELNKRLQMDLPESFVDFFRI